MGLDLQERNRYLERKVNVLNRLAEISIVLNSTFELDPLLTYLMDAAVAITEAESASVLLWDEREQKLRFTATTSDQSAAGLIGLLVPLTGSVAGTCLTENRIIQVDDIRQSETHYDKVDEQQDFTTRSLLAVPMRWNERVIGVLEVVNKIKPPWTTDDHDHIAVLTSQAAVAIGTAQMIIDMKNANQELSELDKLKSDFIAIASHELRTPLAIILGYASFLRDETDNRLRAHAEKVMESGLQLRHIIEDLMNLRYLQQKESDLRREVVALEAVVQDAVHDVNSVVEANGHHLRLELPPGLQVNIDRIRIGMALGNILGNAVRFTTEPGEITVRAEIHEDLREAWISVTDTGIGLEADQLDRIFEKFYQVEDPMTRRFGGMGIGLSIARALIDVHGGRIWAESAGLGQGSTFTFTLPLAEG